MQFVTKEEIEKIECYMYMALLTLARLKIWTIEDQQVGMCLTDLEE